MKRTDGKEESPRSQDGKRGKTRMGRKTRERILLKSIDII